MLACADEPSKRRHRHQEFVQFHDYLATHNADPKPFDWVADADSILDRIKTVCESTSDSGHLWFIAAESLE